MSTDATKTAASPYGVWDRVKVSGEFFDLLITHPVFAVEPKAINTAQYWLTAIDAGMERNDDKPVTWDWKDIYNRFRPYSHPYKVYRNALRDLELIDFTTYRPPPNYGVPGECRKYVITPLGRKLVLDGNHQWLYKLLKDPATWRRNQVAISKRKVRDRVYAEPEKQIVNAFTTAVTFDRDAVWSQLERDKVDDFGTYRSAVHHVSAILEKKFNDLEIENGRIYNNFVNLPREYKPFARFKGKPYVATLDIRACHPTFLGRLLRQFYQVCVDEHLGKASRNHTDQNRLQAADKLHREVNLLALEAECNRWTDIFTNPTLDPRDTIMSDARIQLDKKDMKKCLNSWLNGAKKYLRVTDGRWDMRNNKRLEAWFQGWFPEMAKVWAAMEQREITGNLITEEYEGPLMLTPALYDYAESLGLTLSYEYDGVGVFAERGETELPAKLEKVKAFIQRQSVEKFNVPVVVKGELTLTVTSDEPQHRFRRKGRH
jgi:hypothetical protein